MENSLDIIYEDFSKIVHKPEEFVSLQKSHESDIKALLKKSYDYTKEAEDDGFKCDSLPELIVEDFDLEQIWQQIELQNESFLSKSLFQVTKFIAGKGRLAFEELLPKESDDQEAVNNQTDDENQEGIEENDKESSDNLDADEGDESERELEDADENDHPVRKGKKSIVDDDFFKLDEMEDFLKSEEKKMDQEDDSGHSTESDDENIGNKEIDFFKADSDDEEVDERLKNPKFKDFFRKTDEPRKPKRHWNDEEGDEDDYNDEFECDDEDFNNEDGNDDNDDHSGSDNDANQNDIETKNEPTKSTFEIRQEKLNSKIKQIEEKALSEKPWHLKGEVTAEDRPIDSLLDHFDVNVDLAARPAPVITEKVTIQLEDIIRQRIKDKAFDSVERKEKIIDSPLEYKKKLILDQEKSKNSLAQIYEKEFLEQQEALKPKDDVEEEEKPESHKVIETMMQSLFRKLDALSNFHYTPKPAVPELKIVTNLPAINMEEVAPIANSAATLLAPEEIKNRIKGDIIGKSERSDADKNRERRKKKKKQRIHAGLKKKKEEKLLDKMNPGLGNKYSKEKLKKQLDEVTKSNNVDKMDEGANSKAVKSSNAFFTQLQDEVQTQIKSKLAAKRKKEQNKISAKRVKL